MRPRRPRGNLVKRNATAPGYSFPSASSQEVWKHHIPPTASIEPLTDPRIARLLGVPVGSPVMRRFRVTGPESEPPFQINISWIHPRGVDDAPMWQARLPGREIGCTDWRRPVTGPSTGWRSTGLACPPRTKPPAGDPDNLPVLEIVRVGNSGRDGKPIEVTEYIVASDRVETIHVLHRNQSAQEPWPDEAATHDDSDSGE